MIAFPFLFNIQITISFPINKSYLEFSSNFVCCSEIFLKKYDYLLINSHFWQTLTHKLHDCQFSKSLLNILYCIYSNNVIGKTLLFDSFRSAVVMPTALNIVLWNLFWVYLFPVSGSPSLFVQIIVFFCAKSNFGPLTTMLFKFPVITPWWWWFYMQRW